MSRYINKILKPVLISLLLLLLNNGSAIAGGPWKGRIVDIETKEPLEGAVVLAVWERAYVSPVDSGEYFYEAKEVLTDKDGRFEIPSYITINLLPIISSIEGPSFTIFKPGYGSLQMGLGEYLTGKTSNVEEFELSGKKYKVAPGLIELPRLKTREERKKVLPGLPMYYDDMRKKVKNYIHFLNVERGELGLDLYPIEGGKGK